MWPWSAKKSFLRPVPINSYLSARAREMTSSFRRGRHNVWAVLINSSPNRNARELVQTSGEITKRPSCFSLMTPRKVAHSNRKNQLRTMRRENIGGSDMGFHLLNASQVEMSRHLMSGLLRGHRTERRKRFSSVADRIEDVLCEQL
jgi:hypothetical protein